ncbi:MAG: hypothetical protein ACI97K_003399 [Glaciecola sp.]|jgi:hypothetical protein
MSFPGWIFASIGGFYTHLSTSMAIALNVGAALTSGVSYVLATCFIVHLVARAYWVGLIGLRAAFPDGINWGKTPGLGPLSRKHYRETLPDIDTVIQKTDKLASSLFAVISLLTLSALWFGIILVTILVVAGTVGAKLGGTNAGLSVGVILLLVLGVLGPVMVYLLDAQLAARFPKLCENRFYVGLVNFLRRIAEFTYPKRFVLPVQLTLQSNTRPFLVFGGLLLVAVAIVLIGNVRANAWNNFTLSEEFTYLDNTQVIGGFRSTYYEDMPSELDQLRAWPRVSSFTQSGAYVRLFLPYQPLRDNLLLDDFCSDVESPESRTECLRMFWRVTIDGREVPMSGFIAAERADIKMRGLVGLVPFTGLKPGLHEIEVELNAPAEEGAALVDDRYSEVSYIYVIPIAFTPAYELTLDRDAAGN